LKKARSLIVGAGLAVSVSLPAAATWACVPYRPSGKLDRQQASPGDTVSLRGTGFTRTEPVVVRFNGPSGQVLATLTAAAGTVTGTFTVPDAPPGEYVVLVDHEDPLGTVLFQPVRAALTVVNRGGGLPVVGSVPPPRDRIPTLAARDDGVDIGAVALVAIGVTGVALFVAGAMTLAPSRRRVPVRTAGAGR
jgi:hypothetical protein